MRTTGPVYMTNKLQRNKEWKLSKGRQAEGKELG